MRFFVEKNCKNRRALGAEPAGFVTPMTNY